MPYTYKNSDLPKLDLEVDRGSLFLSWKQQWNDYHSLSGLDGEPAVKQVQVQRMCFARSTISIVNNLGLTDEQKVDQDLIVTALRGYINGQVNQSVERRKL
jgi:hypothetical protein